MNRWEYAYQTSAQLCAKSEITTWHTKASSWRVFTLNNRLKDSAERMWTMSWNRKKVQLASISLNWQSDKLRKDLQTFTFCGHTTPIKPCSMELKLMLWRGDSQQMLSPMMDHLMINSSQEYQTKDNQRWAHKISVWSITRWKNNKWPILSSR